MARISSSTKIAGMAEFEAFLETLDRGVKAGFSKELANYLGNMVRRNITRGNFEKNSPLTLRGRVGGGAGGKPLQDTGNLRNSIVSYGYGDRAIVGSPLKYSSVVHEGATIKPKFAEKLAIPASSKARGYVQAHGGSVRRALERFESDGYFIFFTHNAIVGTIAGKGEILFIRKDSVTIPARQFLVPTPQDENDIQRIFLEWVEEQK